MLIPFFSIKVTSLKDAAVRIGGNRAVVVRSISFVVGGAGGPQHLVSAESGRAQRFEEDLFVKRKVRKRIVVWWRALARSDKNIVISLETARDACPSNSFISSDVMPESSQSRTRATDFGLPHR